jgi:AP-3 complex subunit delta-1
MFEKTLQDIVKGIRTSRRDTALYISQCIAEIKDEINSKDMYVKANALQKLTFLHMMGYSMNWASFATIEVMSSPRFAQKRIGYLAASQGFTQDTDVILLTTNLLKKELRGANGGATGVYEAGLAINCVSNIITEELAQDLLPELTNLTTHSQPYVRKKALLCLFKLFIKYPQGLRLTFDKIQQCLNDTNPAVVSCAVNVITELSHTNPRNYLHLAPAFFDLLTNSNNNWMLIKVVKLLGSLVPEEPRLARKLLDPLAGIVRSTPAKSLLFESAHAIAICLPYCRKNDGSMPSSAPAIVDLCAQTFRDFVEEKDQNLKYLGLVGFGSLVKCSPKVLSTNNCRPLILACLSDEDVTIRTRALGLLPSMASRKNLVELTEQLLQHVAFASGAYKLDLVAKVVEMCSGEKYALVPDFRWYLDTLFRMGHMRGLDAHGELLRSQVCDVALRVLPIRAYAVKRSMDVLLEGNNDGESDNNNSASFHGAFDDADNGRGKHIMPEILPTLAWIVGEYSDLLPEAMTMDSNAVYIYNDDSEGPYHSVLQAITAPTNSNKLSMSTQSVYLQASLKIFAATCANRQVSDSEMEASLRIVFSNLGVYMESTDVEVRERAVTLKGLLITLKLIPELQGLTTTPGLTKLDESEDDDDDEDSNNGQMLPEGNLLTMHGMSLQKMATKKEFNPFGNFIGKSGTSLALRCRNASSTLSYLLKPSPMKPTGAKAQRKKHQSPIGVDLDLDAPLDTSIFSSWIEEEIGHRESSRLSMEAVSFTQQKPLIVSKPKNIALDAISSFNEPSPGAAGSTFGDQRSSAASGLMSSLQPSENTRQYPTSTTGNRPNTANDPFYLNSTPATIDLGESTNTTGNLLNSFGNILLGDDDEVEDAPSKKKKKKDKKQKSSAQASMNVVGQGFGNMTIYESEDDDNDDNILLQPTRRNGGRRKGSELNGLAKVDLSAPLREDEVFLERKHRVVPVREPEAAPVKSKKKKKKSKKETNPQVVDVPSNPQSNPPSSGFDLLDLYNATPKSTPFQQATPSAPTPQASSVMQGQTSSANNAFDDLLGLSYSAPKPTTTLPQNTGSDIFGAANQRSNAQSIPSSRKIGKKPYLRATIKPSSASGSPSVDWSKVELSYRASRSKGEGNTGVSMVVRVQNGMGTSALSGLMLQLKNYGDIPIGDIAPHSSLESSKIGPFSYPSLDVPLEVKGKLTTRDSSVTIKLALPISVYTSPPGVGLTMDQVASELASSQWASHSTKIAHDSSTSPEKIKQKICAFLNMVEVEPANPSFGTLAGRSSTGVPIRALVKVRTDDVKVDIKCGSVALGKAITSELKKLII